MLQTSKVNANLTLFFILFFFKFTQNGSFLSLRYTLKYGEEVYCYSYSSFNFYLFSNICSNILKISEEVINTYKAIYQGILCIKHCTGHFKEINLLNLYRSL